MKVNIKLGNVNHTIHLGAVVKQKLFSGGSIDTIILGADGTYAQKDSKDTNIAQIIEGLAFMTEQRLNAFYDVNGRYPSKILYYLHAVAFIQCCLGIFQTNLFTCNGLYI
ncbi:hypothetical protein N0V91_002626 [Didymella pomorum]|uniref:Uncharacterized protein n=1 Tax=Didymella pomorum TaxID=749634 RepID=A0A9W9DB15_9PLEO|nr:hypothetical protein N0V91_002626 [Didymella pomorum]